MIIASRIPTIITADNVVVLKHGIVEESGAPFKLLSNSEYD